MGKSEGGSEESLPPDESEKLVAPADFDGPTKDRHCTDIFCSILLLCMWIAMTGLGAYAATNGDFRVILYPLDYDGNICGTDYGSIDMNDYPYLVYVNIFSGGVCVKECPDIEEDLTDIYTLVTYGGLYQTENAQLPADAIQIADYSTAEGAKTCTEQLCYPDGDPEQAYTSIGVNRGTGYAFFALDTYEALWRCVPNKDAYERMQNQTGSSDDLALEENDNESFWSKLYSDFWTAKAYILGFGFGVSLAISFLYLFILRIKFLLTLTVWLSIFATIGLIVGVGIYAKERAEYWDNQEPQIESDDTITAARISAYVLWGIAGLLFLVMCFLRKQIQLAIGTVKETSKSLIDMPMIVTLPVVQSAGFIAFMVVWVVYAVYLASLGELKTETYDITPDAFDDIDLDVLDGLDTPQITVRTFVYDDFIKQCAWYLLFCFFWTSQFIIAAGEIIYAMCFAKWYFARDKSKVDSGTVWESLCDSCWYHMGTAAFGSLILAIIKIIRSIIAYFQEKAKEADSKIAGCVLCCCQCCFWCLEKCIRFLNKNAYIHTAIFSTSFCTSAKEAFFLILRNALRIGAIEYVSGAVIFVGKAFIACLTGACAYILIDQQIGHELDSVVGPVILVVLMAYSVAAMFMSVFDMGIATILQCFIADEEMFDGDEMYAEGDLREWIDKYDESDKEG
uniref:Choline transporter-like protein n=1 Tax=Helicotheca tamesis TaxID=374047 RepID=A0A7S2HA85_9STRA|mmetsp:Transcript_1652/g.2381  ORF Transcript_1652/g.2381 Transcript_1652/m.2381 type:complete len:679 (+) Transcript_1652:153-2189(+)|eukprot:CAMPEP_0185727882 /NCGR_PEP_ID=MMETSP1171-20130828/3435_1 /TAXON_ID=374046 /ORGANISM="Helicotheca tamensis, Strain CCMP826" /LENGTH=678 /DNA_ID=CAMNT_0028396527 /DNA_START=1339 /DNA_END=3375 /DNA_ORIENTATION=-